MEIFSGRQVQLGIERLEFRNKTQESDMWSLDS